MTFSLPKRNKSMIQRRTGRNSQPLRYHRSRKGAGWRFFWKNDTPTWRSQGFRHLGFYFSEGFPETSAGFSGPDFVLNDRIIIAREAVILPFMVISGSLLPNHSGQVWTLPVYSFSPFIINAERMAFSFRCRKRFRSSSCIKA